MPIIIRKPIAVAAPRPVPPPGRPAPTFLGSSNGDDTAPEDKAKTQPTKRLPTTRIKFQKQLDIIRAYGIKSQNGTRAASYRDVALVVGIHANTVSLMVGFLVENGFLERMGSETMPVKPVLDFAQAYNWAAETAPRKLAPIIRNSWFGGILLTKLAFRSMSEDEAIAELGGAISADKEWRSNVAMLIEYAVAAALVRRDGTQLSLGEEASTHPTEPGPPRQERTSEQRDDSPAPRSTAAVATGFMTTEGAVQFHVSIRVSMQEMAGWTPDRITAFFAGLAQVLAAKKGTEEIEK
jgi:hypothetical protein